jgi:hypothetical protein
MLFAIIEIEQDEPVYWFLKFLLPKKKRSSRGRSGYPPGREKVKSRKTAYYGPGRKSEAPARLP